MDLKTTSTASLKELQNEIACELNSRIADERAAARQQIKQIAELAGIDLRSLANARVTSPKPAKTVEPKYRNPDNAAQTWTGRGRSPLWADAMRKAGTLESARIVAG